MFQRVRGSVEIKANVHIRLFDCAGYLKQELYIKNTTTTAGKYGIADRILNSPTLDTPSHMAIGTGTPTATALGNELDRSVLVSKTRSLAVVTMEGSWSSGNPAGIITEVGLFDAASAGNMWCSASITPITKGVDDSLAISWLLTVN